MRSTPRPTCGMEWPSFKAMSGTLAGLMCPLVMAFDAPLLLRLHATVHGYVGDVRGLQPNGMIAPGLPCGRAGRNHDNITLYSCDRPSPYCSRARICPGTGVNRLTFAPGQKSLSRYAISGHFREPGQDNPQSPHTPTNRIGGIQPIPKSTYCPGSHVERLTCKPGQRELSRYAKNTRFRKPGQ